MEEQMPTSEKNLADAFYETLKDVYWAEKQALKACKKSAKAARAPELKKAFQDHAVETEGHIERLQQVFELIGKAARAKTCEAMQGISAEMEEDLEDFGGTPAGDAVLIGCGQAVEHYEIGRYGMLKAWANQLGIKDAVKLLDATLQEEKKADALLSQIAEKGVNANARGAMAA
jgi:ferritin-like metal-binding protein YciE